MGLRLRNVKGYITQTLLWEEQKHGGCSAEGGHRVPTTCLHKSRRSWLSYASTTLSPYSEELAILRQHYPVSLQRGAHK
ncbi:unnamed protein product [Lota lota]